MFRPSPAAFLLRLLFSLAVLVCLVGAAEHAAPMDATPGTTARAVAGADHAAHLNASAPGALDRDDAGAHGPHAGDAHDANCMAASAAGGMALSAPAALGGVASSFSPKPGELQARAAPDPSGRPPDLMVLCVQRV